MYMKKSFGVQSQDRKNGGLFQSSVHFEILYINNHILYDCPLSYRRHLALIIEGGGGEAKNESQFTDPFKNLLTFDLSI